MSIYIWDKEIKDLKIWTTTPSAVYLWENKVRPAIPPYLCFTAGVENSTVTLNKRRSPTTVSLETSTDWQTWSDYTIGTAITLSSVGDKVYWRNKSETTTWFSTSSSAYYYFSMTWTISASGDVNYLLNKNSTTTLPWNCCFYGLFSPYSWDNTALTTPPELPATTLTQYCYWRMFMNCTALTKAPELPATTLADYCYYAMFYNCQALTLPPKLPATTLTQYCYSGMFQNCTSLNGIPLLSATTLPTYCYYTMFQYTLLKMSRTQDSNYTQAYIIPTTWTGTDSSYSTSRMFYGNWWVIDSPNINTTYYLHKDNVIVE